MLQKAAEPGNKKAPAHKATGSKDRKTRYQAAQTADLLV
jgi:hypothetical protein